MNIDWVVIAVISSVVAMIIGLGFFVYQAMKLADEDKSQNE